MIKAMCRLSCSVCHKKDQQRNPGSARSGEFNSVEQLKSHLFHRHKLFMCSLCLEGRKIFISEQKLYSKAQLSQHVKTGDSVADGSESERGGFTGHPMCEFCQNPFYGDNELYSHMSTEHFTCHLCQRQRPGQYEYFKNYDSLEFHFHQDHFLCEDEACLAKKFIVFATEAEIKRHDAVEHRGRMSRLKRNSSLQIPTSFQTLHGNEQVQRGRVRRNNSDSSDHQLARAIQNSLETAYTERFDVISSNSPGIPTCTGTSSVRTVANSFDSLAANYSEGSSRNQKLVGKNSENAILEESSFPPLPAAPSSSRQSLEVLRSNTMAARLRPQNTVKVLNYARASPAASHHPNSSGSGVLSSSRILISSQRKPTAAQETVPFSHATQATSSPVNGLLQSSNFASTQKTPFHPSRTSGSASAPNAVDRMVTNLGLVSANQVDNGLTHSHPVPKVEDVQSANKVLVEKIRAALEFDEDKFTAFKVISADYRRDLIDTAEYLAHVYQFGLSHLILELAGLCPDIRKQRELVEIYNYNMKNGSSEHGPGPHMTDGGSKSKSLSKKGKEKCADNSFSSPENALGAVLNSRLVDVQPSHKPCKEVAELLSVDGSHSAKGKMKVLVDELDSLSLLTEPKASGHANSTGGGSKMNVGAVGGGNRPRKKASKFLKNRLGDTSAAAFSDNGWSVPIPNDKEGKTDGIKDPPEMLPIRGAWRNGGGHKLVTMAHRDRKR
ncbi:hypothetical protein Tsubulata_038347 [Turnera subulata]|uniref:C2H2-type domain-containing protein n=1 Tax=Turnera subulata TaxID=218843 RepID=A0A9Q0FF13_9ROSI|nr:hypothetical protein Tsubulata_038347 [Turnera subulata]